MTATFATPMPPKRPHIAHVEPSWKGDRPAQVAKLSREKAGADGVRAGDFNWQVVFENPVSHSLDEGWDALNMHWSDPRRNNYLFVAPPHSGRPRKMTKTELRRKIKSWKLSDVLRWRRPVYERVRRGRRRVRRLVRWERPMTYRFMVRYAQRLGVTIAAELKHWAFADPRVMRQMLKWAKEANHPAWFTKLYHMGPDLARTTVAAVRQAGGYCAVIFGTFQHERVAYAVRRRSWAVQPSATW